jgi:hypothetical protein
VPGQTGWLLGAAAPLASGLQGHWGRCTEGTTACVRT